MKKIIVALALILMMPGLGWAMVPGRDQGEGIKMHDRAFQRLSAALNLTPEQNQKLKEMREGLRKETIPLRNEMMSKRFELRALWMQANPDEGKILAKQKEIHALRSDLQEKITRGRLEMRKVLTPDQQAQLTFLLSRSRAWKDHYRGSRSRGPAHGHHGEGPGMGLDSRS